MVHMLSVPPLKRRAEPSGQGSVLADLLDDKLNMGWEKKICSINHKK